MVRGRAVGVLYLVRRLEPSFAGVVAVARFVGPVPAQASVAAFESSTSLACHRVKYGCFSCTPSPCETTSPVICSRKFERKSRMASRSQIKRVSSGEALGLKLLQSVREMKAAKAARVTKVEPNEVVQARQRTGLSQAQFAEALSISKRTLQEWEQGRRSPSGAAQTLIRIAKNHPEVVREALA